MINYTSFIFLHFGLTKTTAATISISVSHYSSREFSICSVAAHENCISICNFCCCSFYSRCSYLLKFKNFPANLFICCATFCSFYFYSLILFSCIIFLRYFNFHEVRFFLSPFENACAPSISILKHFTVYLYASCKRNIF